MPVEAHKCRAAKRPKHLLGPVRHGKGKAHMVKAGLAKGPDMSKKAKHHHPLKAKGHAHRKPSMKGCAPG